MDDDFSSDVIAGTFPYDFVMDNMPPFMTHGEATLVAENVAKRRVAWYGVSNPYRHNRARNAQVGEFVSKLREYRIATITKRPLCGDDVNETIYGDDEMSVSENYDTITLLQVQAGARLYGCSFDTDNTAGKKKSSKLYTYKSHEQIASGELVVVQGNYRHEYKVARVVEEQQADKLVPGVTYKWIVHRIDPNNDNLDQYWQADDNMRRQIAVGEAMSRAREALGSVKVDMPKFITDAAQAQNNTDEPDTSMEAYHAEQQLKAFDKPTPKAE